MGINKASKSRLLILRTSGTMPPGTSDRSFNLDCVVSEAEAAEIMGYSKDTLRREFRAGRAPSRVRLSGRRIGYRLSAIYTWLERHTERPGAMA
jgi:predicted DNA-binding transcriptional regulator AlpA